MIDNGITLWRQVEGGRGSAPSFTLLLEDLFAAVSNTNLALHLMDIGPGQVPNELGWVDAGNNFLVQANNNHVIDQNPPGVHVAYANAGSANTVTECTINFNSAAGDSDAGVVVRVQDATHFLLVQIVFSTTPASGTFSIYSEPGDVLLKQLDGLDFANDQDYTLTISCSGNSVVAALSGDFNATIGCTTTSYNTRTNYGLWANTGDAYYKNFEVLSYAGPTSLFFATPLAGGEPLSVQFNSYSPETATWSWDFGDGNTDTTANPINVYASDGLYTPSLIVGNTHGSSFFSRTNYINVAVSPPVTSFTQDTTSGDVPLTVIFDSSATTNDPDSWFWSFGDGGTSTEQNPTYEYDACGTFTVALTATNTAGSDTNTQTDLITANSTNAPTASFTEDTTSGNVPFVVQFTDTSTECPNSWSWDFGDGGSSTDQNPSHTYEVCGVYTVVLQVSNNVDSSTDTETDLITASPSVAPTVSFTQDTTSGGVPLTVNFTDTSTQCPTSWSWDFGDGGSSTDQNPTYEYDACGVYTVSLTADNGIGSGSHTEPNLINATDSPSPAFEANAQSGPAPLTVNFTDESTGCTTSWSWDFGDGHTSTEQNPTHVYTMVGVYNVSLTATNDQGSNTLTQNGFIYVPDILLKDNFTEESDALLKDHLMNIGPGQVANELGWVNASENFYCVGGLNVAADSASGADVAIADSGVSNVFLKTTINFNTISGSDDCGVVVRALDPTHYLLVYFAQGVMQLYKFPDITNLASVSYTYADNTDYPATVSCIGDSIVATLPGQIMAFNTSDYLTGRKVGLYGNQGNTAYYSAFETDIYYGPEATFTADNTNINAGDTVNFASVDIGYSLSNAWSWDFGDSGTATDKNPSYQYNTPGVYTVSLIVNNMAGNSKYQIVDYITVN